MKLRVLRHLGALVVMAGGSSMVFAMVLSMNSEPPRAPKKQPGRTVSFRVSRKKRPPAKKKVRKQPRPVRRRAAPRAPLPKLGVGLSGVDLGIPPLSGGSLADLGDSLVGGEDTVRDVVMTENTVDVPPRPIRRVAPKYPARARADGLTGRVTLKLLIGPSGSVLDVRVVEVSGTAEFERAALQAVRGWRFQPALYKGQPVKVWASQTVRFKLS
jgi:protein TonB